MKLIQAIIVDDEQSAVEVIKRYVEKIEWIEITHSFNDPIKALQFVNENQTDLVFLDINMPGLSGIEFVKALIRKPAILLTTAYSEFAIDGYDIDAIDYLLKPISFDRFLKGINRLYTKFNPNVSDANRTIVVKSGHEYHNLSINDISFLQKDNNYLEIHMVGGLKILIRENMSSVFDIFPEDIFIRIHKSSIINKKQIKVIEAHQITLKSGLKLALGANYRDQIYKEFKI